MCVEIATIIQKGYSYYYNLNAFAFTFDFIFLSQMYLLLSSLKDFGILFHLILIKAKLAAICLPHPFMTSLHEKE